MSSAIYAIMRKLPGNSLQDVLQMYVPQFYFCVESISKELEEEAKLYKKHRKK
jgi:hypothetical protein